MTLLHPGHMIGGLRSNLFARFGLRENPFGVTPNPKYLYESPTHKEAKSSLIIGVECGVGFQALIAPPGMGKTTILSHILQRFQGSALTAFLFQLQGNSTDFLCYLLSELGGNDPVPDLASAQDRINQLLIKQFRSGRPVIIVIDEAQTLSTDVLETIRLLSNFETASDKLLQIIFSGQPQLAEKLASPELAQLRQRISIFTTLTPFDRPDTEKYIEHRLRLAGYRGRRLFTPRAVTMVWMHSQGIPRNVNALCFNALLFAGSEGRQQIDEGAVLEVIKDRDLDLLALPAAGGQPSSGGPRIERLKTPILTQTCSKEHLTDSLCNLDPMPDRANFLAQLSTMISTGTLSQQAMLQQISHAAQVLTHANGVAIAIRHNDLVICQARVGDIAPDLGTKLEIDSGISGRCFRDGESLRCDDTKDDARVNAEFCRRLGLRSLAVVPVGRKPAVDGVLEVFSEQPRAFRDDQMNLLEQLAELVIAAQSAGSFASP